MTEQRDQRAIFAARRADPEFEARRLAGIRAAWERKRQHGAESVMLMSERAKAAWERRKRRGETKLDLSDAERKRRRDQFAINRSAPEFEEVRRRRSDAASREPKVKAKRSANTHKINAAKRGFRVPARLWKDYQFLMRSKGMRAQEAARALGLVREVPFDG